MQQPEALNADLARSPSDELAPAVEATPRGPSSGCNAQSSGCTGQSSSSTGPIAGCDGPIADSNGAVAPETTLGLDTTAVTAGPSAADLRVLESERLQQIWSALQSSLQKALQREQFETWFRGATLARADDQTVALAVQNSFARDWLAKHYADVLDNAITHVFGGRRQVVLEVDPELTMAHRAARNPAPAPLPALGAAAMPPAPGQSASGALGTSRTAGSSAAPGTSGAPGSPASREPATPARRSFDDGPGSRLLWASDGTLNPHYRFDTFVVGPCNRFAHAASLGVSENPGKAYNPFFLHGSVGLGKTHLLQSLCYTILERDPNARILYLSCETFVNHFISALETSDLAKFRNKYRNVDVLVVDDIHLLANKERTQEEFFHTFNTLYNAGKQIVLSSDSPPKEIPTLHERLVSRFKWGLVTEIEQPCYETRVAILKRKGKERGRELPDDVAALLADQLETNIRELEGAVTRLIGFASLNNQPLTCEVARRVLRDVFSTVRGQPSMEDIQRIVTSHFNVKLTDLQSRKRTNAIALPRQVSMFLARKITRHSLEEIGGFFGGRDHSTVLYAIEKVEGEMRDDPRFRELVAGFLTQLQRASS
ncbi:MAG: chromosomal replication initiator protein DnaA [Planctomycetes bacterium]|nr:chromosomal replication initiator protein DnaA [Planctomycetota bacterium]